MSGTGVNQRAGELHLLPMAAAAGAGKAAEGGLLVGCRVQSPLHTAHEQNLAEPLPQWRDEESTPHFQAPFLADCCTRAILQEHQQYLLVQGLPSAQAARGKAVRECHLLEESVLNAAS